MKDVFSIRRSLDRPVGVPGDFISDTIADPQLMVLASSPLMSRWIQRDTMPIPSTHFREGYYAEHHLDYWLSGLRDYLAVKESCPNLNLMGAKLFDFGGATGRVSRHFHAQEEMSEVLICDVNINNVDWVIEHLPSGVSAFKNSAVPTLPIPDNYFDIVTAFSVFTHMGEYELAWLYELKRILKPEGTLYVTVHNDNTWSMLPSTWLYEMLLSSEDFRKTHPATPELNERLVFEYSAESVYNCHTFHPNSYIHRVWSKILRIVAVRPLAHGYQCAVILRKES